MLTSLLNPLFLYAFIYHNLKLKLDLWENVHNKLRRITSAELENYRIRMEGKTTVD